MTASDIHLGLASHYDLDLLAFFFQLYFSVDIVYWFMLIEIFLIVLMNIRHKLLDTRGF